MAQTLEELIAARKNVIKMIEENKKQIEKIVSEASEENVNKIVSKIMEELTNLAETNVQEKKLKVWISCKTLDNVDEEIIIRATKLDSLVSSKLSKKQIANYLTKCRVEDGLYITDSLDKSAAFYLKDLIDALENRNIIAYPDKTFVLVAECELPTYQDEQSKKLINKNR